MSIERKAISALKWATAAKLVVQIASWAGTLVVVRLLTPEDYGLMAKVAVVCAIAGAIAELGLEAAIVRSVDIARDDLRKIYGVSLLFGAGMTTIVVAAAPLLSQLFQEPRLTWPIAGASLQIIVGAVAIVPSALWTRDLSFRRLAKIEMVSGVTSIAATLLLALLGAGVWALVLGTLFGAIARSAALLIFGERVRPLFSLRGIGESPEVWPHAGRQQGELLRRRSVGRPDRQRLSVDHRNRPVLRGAAARDTADGEGHGYDQSDHAAGGGTAAGRPATRASGCAEGHRSHFADRLSSALGDFGGRTGTRACPAWTEVAGGGAALTILPLIVPIRMVCSVMFTTSLALGNRQLDLRNTIVNFVLIPSGFFVGAHWGLVGLCSAWLVSVPLAYAFSVPTVLRFIGIRCARSHKGMRCACGRRGRDVRGRRGTSLGATRPAPNRCALHAECRGCRCLLWGRRSHIPESSGYRPKFRPLGPGQERAEDRLTRVWRPRTSLERTTLRSPPAPRFPLNVQ